MQTLETSNTTAENSLKQAVDGVQCGRDEHLALIMRQHNQRMYRIARSILRHDTEAEDIVQDAFIVPDRLKADPGLKPPHSMWE